LPPRPSQQELLDRGEGDVPEGRLSELPPTGEGDVHMRDGCESEDDEGSKQPTPKVRQKSLSDKTMDDAKQKLRTGRKKKTVGVGSTDLSGAADEPGSCDSAVMPGVGPELIEPSWMTGEKRVTFGDESEKRVTFDESSANDPGTS
jgi:hypothetical protein